MKFGKLDNIETVDFSLPPDPADQAVRMQGFVSRKGKMKIHLGCTGWSMKEWTGKLYPPGTKPKDYLQLYSKQFPTIELNTTHYRIPDEQTIQKWRQESAEGFTFCPKIPQRISHSRTLGRDDSQLTVFCKNISGLNEKLGCCFMQLPPYFGLERLSLLQGFLERWPADIPLAVEVRHESWFQTETALLQLTELLARQEKSIVITDVAGRRDVLHMACTTPVAMVRFVGNDLHPTDYTRLDAWVSRLQQWEKQGLHEVYFFPHEPDNIRAPEISVYLAEQLKATGVFEVKVPKLKDENEGKQIALF